MTDTELKNVLDELLKEAEKNLSPRRFMHSLGVMEEAARIGEREGVDPLRCRVAGILHDFAKEYSPEVYESLGLEWDREFGNGIVHGEAAAIVGKNEFGIDEEDILEAVRWHTTGHAGMGKLAQIVFVADYTEPYRQGEMFDRVRAVLASFGLMSAVAEECRVMIENLCRRGACRSDEIPEQYRRPPYINLNTIETMNWALKGDN